MLKIFIIILIVLCIVAALIIKEIKRELSCFQTVRYKIESEKLQGIEKKIVFLSDLHNRVYGEENRELLEAIQKENPDYILIGGDLLVSNNKSPYLPALYLVEKLVSICPVYYANGNHEQRIKERIEDYEMSYAAYHRILKNAGVHFLENDSAILLWNNQKIRLTGLEIPLDCYKKIGRDKLQTEEIVERVGENDTESYEILLAHNPSFTKKYLEWGADLILSGHLHGGIVRLPWLGGAISPSFEIFPKYSGDHYKVQNKDVVVSKGLGTHTFNIRLFNPAELVVLHLKGNTSCEKQENPV